MVMKKTCLPSLLFSMFFITCLMNISPTKCMLRVDYYDEVMHEIRKRRTKREEYFTKIGRDSSFLTLGWTVLSAASLTGTKIFNKYAAQYPANKEKYIKLGLRTQKMSKIAILPAISLALLCPAIISLPTKMHKPVAYTIGMPYFLMSYKPAELYNQYQYKNS